MTAADIRLVGGLSDRPSRPDPAYSGGKGAALATLLRTGLPEPDGGGRAR